jgi:hypothetical protein
MIFKQESHMSVSSVVDLLEATADRHAATSGPAVVDVLFPIAEDEQWPPYPAETIDAVLIAHDLAEVQGVPWFVTNISRGDIVRVRHDGIGYVGGPVISGGGHSTIHVMATTEAELAPIVEGLTTLGATALSGLTPPMLTVDVAESIPLSEILDLLVEAESLTCAFNIACCQHRLPVRG